MKRRNFVLGIGTVTAAGTALIGTGAYSEGYTDRNVTIETVGDEDAYLRLEYNDEIEFDCETETTLLWMTNHLKSEITDVDVRIGEELDGVAVEVFDIPGGLQVGQEGVIMADLTCTGDVDGTSAPLDIEVEGDDLAVDAHRTDEIAITCDCPSAESAWTLAVEDGDTDPDSDRLDELSGISRWGWYVRHDVGSDGTAAALWAGAGGNDLNDGTHVGDVEIGDDGEDLLVDIEMSDESELEGSSLHVSTDVNGIADTNAAPGQFDYSSVDGSYQIPFSTIDGDVSEDDELILALHANVLP